jgi:N-acetylmuramoyl-L-alanine amidase
MLPARSVFARVSHTDAWAREKFTTAERMREALNGRPAAQRSRRDYQRVIDAFRRVYYGAPASSRADASVVALAELEVEMGRRFDDNKILRNAIRNYQFLRREYPGSKYRFDALFTIGEIYKDDLDDPAEAKATFEEFLRRYPHHRLVAEARDAITEINNLAEAKDREQQRVQSTRREAEKYQAAADVAGTSNDSSSPTAVPDDTLPDAEQTMRTEEPGRLESAAKKDPPDNNGDDGSDDAGPNSAKGEYPRVTMIRHWSTPDYTRVAIDLEQDVKFGAQRLSDPDRIFFDLYNTRLASTLVGKSFDVDDGFLKKIRVAQFKPGMTRVVLDVDNLSDYDAFLLPNPPRLVVDVHGKKEASTLAHKQDAPQPATSASEDKRPDAGETNAEDSEIASVQPAGHPDREPKIEPSKTVQPAAHSSDGSVPVPTAEKAEVPKPPSASASADSPNKRTVPRKIVEADDDDATPAEARKVASLRVEDLRTDVIPEPKKTSRRSTRSASKAHDDDLETTAPTKSGATNAKRTGRATRSTADIDVREAQPTAEGDRSLIRALGLKIGKIVIDPGHGGHDTGTIGPHGLEEKDVVLDVGRRLGKLLETRLGADVVYTRKDDTFIPLETRTAIANQEQADLFVSIHANSSRDRSARGVETYYLNFTTNADALEVAARENAVSAKSIHELGDLVKKITLKEKVEESREFASDVQESLHAGLAAKSPAIRDRGVKKAPFIVLIGANMPSILAEISFVSNPTDEKKLRSPEYRQRIAEALYRGIQKYVRGLSGMKVDTKIAKSDER